MKNNIIITKIWQDNFMFELQTTCSCPSVCADCSFYIQGIQIEELSRKILLFCEDQADCHWENIEDNQTNLPYFSLNLIRKDNRGHVLAEICIKNNDCVNQNRYSCHFYIETEIQPLISFAYNLLKIEQQAIGLPVTLHDSTG